MHAAAATILPTKDENLPATDKIQEIRSRVFRELDLRDTEKCCAFYKVEWPLGAFMRSQSMDADTPIGRIVTITGSAVDCQATTCEEYSSSTWPLRGLRFLQLLQYALDNTDRESQGALISLHQRAFPQVVH